MNKNQEQLAKMLKENKISQEDYDILLGAMDKKSFFSKTNFLLLVNPFQKIAGVKALIFGLPILLVTTFLNTIANGSLVLSRTGFIQHQTTFPGFFALTCQYLVMWFILSICFALTATLFRKKIRFIDFLGTLAFAHYPSLLSAVIMATLQSINANFYSSMIKATTAPHFSLGTTTFLMFALIVSAWQMTTYFYAFKESSGLTSKKLGWGFAAPFIVAGIIATQIIKLITA
jgi:hypothetical protein